MKGDGNIATFLDYITMGTSGMVKEAVNPKEPYSAEHWMNSIGLAGTLAGGGLAGNTLKTSGGSPKVTKSPNREKDSDVDVGKGTGNLADAMLKSNSAKAWGTLADRTNQGVKHFNNYWELYPERIPSLG